MEEKMVVEDWSMVLKSRFDLDLSILMPYALIKKLQAKGAAVDPVIIGEVNGMKVIIDNIESFSEKDRTVMFSGKKVFLGSKNIYMAEIEEQILLGNPIVYKWRIDNNLNITGMVYSIGKFVKLEDEVIYQEGRCLKLKNAKRVFVVWSSISNSQKREIANLTQEELIRLYPNDFNINYPPDLTDLINVRDRKERLVDLDVPEWFKK